MRWLDGIIDSMGMSLSKLQEFTGDHKSPGFSVHGISEARKLERVAIPFSQNTASHIRVALSIIKLIH